MRIFIVDDSVIVRERLKVMLSELHEVDVIGEAEDGHQAMKGIHELSPDLDQISQLNVVFIMKIVKVKETAFHNIMGMPLSIDG